jgi:hypothetical protein
LFYPSYIKEGSDDGNGDDKKDKDDEQRGDAFPENQVDEPFSLTHWIENHLELIEEWFKIAAAEFYSVIFLHNNSLLIFSSNLFLYN